MYTVPIATRDRQMATQLLFRSGIALVLIDGVSPVAPSLIEHAIKWLAEGNAERIFEGEDQGQMKYSRQRMQIPVSAESGAPAYLTTSISGYTRMIEGHIIPVLEGLHGPGTLELQPPMLLGNKPEKTVAVERQALHVDVAWGALGYVIILALVENTTLLVAPGSHFWAFHRGNKFTDSMPPSFQVERIVLHPGEFVIMHGNTVHAGDAGVVGEWAPRLHWHVVPAHAGKEREGEITYLISKLGKKFTDKFRFPL